ncbi:unnamed protein product [Lymnaea stagnalis]|uniref:2-(3-amino-3-carboxypropyl)histidine synthase subunit 2 n=1 Tax=Lymnaea stagnalis TaxID=6523 RepID=A0AAV2I4Q3_LYMST
MTSAFSSGDDVITRKIQCTPETTSSDNLFNVYEVDRCLSWIGQHSFKMIALQFPDELLIDAPRVVALLQGALKDVLIFILGDTSYGSCCVDEVGAQHYRADCIIHYGHACLSPTTRLPVLYVFGQSAFDTNDCVSQIKDICPDSLLKAVLVYDTVYFHAIDKVYSRLQEYYKQLIVSKLVESSRSSSYPSHQIGAGTITAHVPPSPFLHPDGFTNTDPLAANPTTTVNKCGRSIELPMDSCIDDYSFIYIGNTQSPALINMMMTFNKSQFYTYSPSDRVSEKVTVNMNKALMKRYYLIERAKDANIVGIVAGTLGVGRYREMIEHLKSLLKKAGKKSYTLVVGKLNPAKLANFAEVDVFVLVSCPESSIFDQSEFYRPIVSPLEMEIACNQAREWTSQYSSDFTELLPGSSMYVQSPDQCDTDDCRPDVSLISNRIRTLGVKASPAVSESASDSKDLVLRSDMTLASGAADAGEYLSSRSWKGLEQKLGETPVGRAVEGQSGIAASYQNETSPS